MKSIILNKNKVLYSLLSALCSFFILSSCTESGDPSENTNSDTDTGIFYFTAALKIGDNNPMSYRPTYQIFNKSDYIINIVCKQDFAGMVQEFGFDIPKSKKTGTISAASFVITIGNKFTLYSRTSCNYTISRLTKNEIEGIFTFSGKSPTGEVVSLTDGRFSVKLPE
ncbi:MAG: hypothetical protein RO257_11610 [Candidatus Kapabacteria bacterium]|nr:hypothetical protein [Candidatus Kapabacteria bacterium]